MKKTQAHLAMESRVLELYKHTRITGRSLETKRLENQQVLFYRPGPMRPDKLRTKTIIRVRWIKGLRYGTIAHTRIKVRWLDTNRWGQLP